jgi:hypothetical protein
MAQDVVRSDISVYDVQSTPDPSSRVEHPGGTGACSTQQVAVGMAFAVCVDAPCDTLLDSGVVQYTERVEVGGCSAESLVGTCSTATFGINYYNGDVASLKMGCGFQAGKWVDVQS